MALTQGISEVRRITLLYPSLHPVAFIAPVDMGIDVHHTQGLKLIVGACDLDKSTLVSPQNNGHRTVCSKWFEWLL